jgi:RNA polymerase sigma-70 factor (ECF subfamily)
MVRYDKNTEMGGAQVSFQTTHWSEVIDARATNPDRQTEVVNALITRYWKPVYCYLRRKGCSNEQAKDLTQGFFYEVALGRNLFAQADQKKGKFRTFLLTALDRYSRDVYEMDNAQKRKPEGQLASLDTEQMAGRLDSQQSSRPEEVFHYAWASDVLNEVLATVKVECCQNQRQAYWEVFHGKVVVPILDNCDPSALKDLCSNLAIKDEQTASNMISYVKKQFQSTMRRHLRQFVSSDSEVEEEFADIFSILSKNNAR